MAMCSSTVQPATKTTDTAIQTTGNDALASILSAVILSVYAGQKSRRQLRKLQRRMTWLLIKQKVRNAFKPASVDRRTLTIILLAVLVLALVFLSPLAALVLAIIGLILLLAGVI